MLFLSFQFPVTWTQQSCKELFFVPLPQPPPPPGTPHILSVTISPPVSRRTSPGISSPLYSRECLTPGHGGALLCPAWHLTSTSSDNRGESGPFAGPRGASNTAGQERSGLQNPKTVAINRRPSQSLAVTTSAFFDGEVVTLLSFGPRLRPRPSRAPSLIKAPPLQPDGSRDGRLRFPSPSPV